MCYIQKNLPQFTALQLSLLLSEPHMRYIYRTRSLQVLYTTILVEQQPPLTSRDLCTNGQTDDTCAISGQLLLTD